MKHSAALVDLDRQVMWQLNRFLWRVCVLIVVLPGVSLPALAGDRALADVIGYSGDGRYFAFEEFGIEDGSGFAYSTIYMIDLVEDRWVIGTPIRMQAEDEAITLIAIRRKAQAEAQSRLDDLRIHEPAEPLAFLGGGMLDVDGQTLGFGLPGFSELDGPHDAFELKVAQFKTKGAAPCKEWFEDEPLGFGLQLVHEGTTNQVHLDKVLPRSRGCPVDYRIKGVYMPFGDRDLTYAIALISVFTHGFEGPDQRYLAIPIGHGIKQ